MLQTLIINYAFRVYPKLSAFCKISNEKTFGLCCQQNDVFNWKSEVIIVCGESVKPENIFQQFSKQSHQSIPTTKNFMLALSF